MKIETPQILWHNGSEGNGKPAPLYTVSLLPKIYMKTNNDAKSQTHGSQDEKAKRSIDMGMNANANANHQNQDQDDTEILATAGNSNEIHLWKIQLTAQHSNDTSKANLTATSTSKNHEGDEDQDQDEPPAKKPKVFSVASPGIRHITTLTRHQQSINTVAFSPNGHHLASAGDGGTLILHTISSEYRTLQPAAANENNQATATALTSHKFWNEKLQSEKDLSIKIVHTGAEDVMDLSWSQDSTRFMIGTLDHSVLVFEEVQAQVQVPCHDHDRERQSLTINIETKKWNCVWKNTKEHTHYVQGVAFDPLGVYMASQGSDRSVRVWARKGNAKHSSSTSTSSALSASSTSLATVNGNGNGEAKKVLGDQDKNIDSNVKESTNATQITSVNGMTTNTNTHTQTNRSGNIRMTTARDVERHLGGKFDVGKAKVLKYRNLPTNSSNHTNTSANANASEENEVAHNQAVRKRHFFADESTVESFFRRLAWSSDGAFLITPASLWHSSGDVTDASGSASASGPSFATYLFARHQYDRPYKVLHGLEKPSVVIRPNPVLFQLPRQVQSDLKENMDDNHYVHASPSSVASNDMRWNVHSHSKIPYRSIFAVLTVDSILIYDTFHSKPLCIARGLHYAGLTDCSWSSDGHNLVVSSTDGYISMISFAKGELGEVYESRKEIEVSSSCEVHDLKSSISAEAVVMRGISLSQSQMPPKVKATLPPCEPGQSAVLVGPPAKKARTIVSENVMQVRKKGAKRVTPILIANGHPVDKGGIGMGDEEGKEASEVVGGVTKLSLENSVQ